MYYILNDDKTTSPVEDLMTWARSFETSDRRIARTVLEDDCVVSTVFLGLDHQFGNGPPLLFETMVFGGADDQLCWRYPNYDDAIAGHNKAVEQVRGLNNATG
jgi:hypothetical protein